MSWIDDLLISDIAWSGNISLQYAETTANVGYYDANSNSVYLINLSNTSGYLLPPNVDIPNFVNVYSNESNVVFQFADYEWVIYYEPKFYGNGNVTIVCATNCCSGCGAEIHECECIEVPEEPGCGLQPGDIIYQDIPEVRSNVVLSIDEYKTLYAEINNKCPGCISKEKQIEIEQFSTDDTRTIQLITQLPRRITAEVVQEDVNGLSVTVKHATGKFLKGYPIGKLGQDPCTLVNIVYLEYDFFFGGYIIDEAGQFLQDCYFPCGPRNIPDANSCVNLGPLDNFPISNIFRERDYKNVYNNGFYDGYYILPNLTQKTRALNNDEPYTPIGHLEETWTDANTEYTVIGMDVTRLKYNAYVLGISTT